MSDETKEKVSEATAGADSLQVQISDSTPASPTSALTPEAISAISESLKPVIEEVIERKFKSTTDKRFSKLERGENVMKEVLAALKEEGVAVPKELQRDLEMRDYIDQKFQQAVTPDADKSMSGNGVGSRGNFNAVEELTKLGLDTNDAEVVALVKGKTFRSPDHFRAEATALALRKAKTPSTSDTTTTPLTGGSGAKKLSDAQREEISGQLIQLMKSPSANKDKIAALNATLKEA